MTAKSRWRLVSVSWVTAGLMLAALGCARGSGSAVPKPEPAAPDSVFLDVINDNYYEARVYAVYDGGRRHPLGSVPGNQSEEGMVFQWQPRPLAFEVHLVVGFGRYLSHTVDVGRGEYLVLRLPPNFSTSGSFTRLSG